MSTRRAQLTRLLADDPKDPFLRYGLAMEEVKDGQHERAARLLQELLNDSPEYVPAYFHCAQAYLRAGNEADAKKVLESGISAARKAGDLHAAEEMQGLRGTIEH